ncbi:MAG: hypothetical protein KA371_12400 [Acidobacteria bacterium]|nr:hypothetical protein [Acidobacteriota bacterium]
MSSLRRLGGAVVLTAVVVLSTACAAPPARAEQPPATETRWRTLGQWTGTGSRQTGSFDVATGALRLGWDARAEGTAAGDGARRLRVWLHSAISGRPLQLVVDAPGAGTGTVHVADDPRVSYLVIEAEGVRWTATLDEALGPAIAR